MRGKRRTPNPSKVGDDPCFNCGKPGSTCPDCGEVICAVCNVNPYAADGHEPAAHLTPPPPPIETDVQRLIRENRELETQLRGTLEDQLRARNQKLKAELAKKEADAAAIDLAKETIDLSDLVEDEL